MRALFSSRFSSAAVALTLSWVAIGCGGRLNPDDGCPDDRCVDGGDTGLVDSSADSIGDPDTSPDTAPTGCGPGYACTSGTSCRPDSCNTCYCSGGTYSCTAMWCGDSGPPPPPPPLCPSYVPLDGTTCSGVVDCTYSNGCGGTTYAYCTGTRWAVKSEPCSSPTCPKAEPTEGTPCKGPIKCGYTNACGGFDTAYCDVSPYWKIARGDCPPPPPPPPPSCPTLKPAPFSACTGLSNCSWNNGCGNITYGYCDGKSWNMKEPGCIPGCPSSKPVGGAACKPLPTGGSCQYIAIAGTSCTTQCFCADDGRWACLTPPCAGTGGGSPGG
ncbi:MAG: hypothetical protein IPJ34_06830 [Myxococcales bacterium]|nr:hypothetical protein [Myxococcales bacterium]